MSFTSPKKPSPLSFGSPRSSPNKRSESPLIQSNEDTPARNFSPRSAAQNNRSNNATSSPTAQRNNVKTGDPLSRLTHAQIHELRESFQVLDRDNSGQVNREDVAEALTQLGQDPSASVLESFLPSSASTVSLPTYLQSLSSLLSPMSPPSELSAAFSAFDLDDSGQLDVEQLRDVLLHTPPEDGERRLTEQEIDSVLAGFTSRRAFGKNGLGGNPTAGRKGDVFRYFDFIASLTPGGSGKSEGPNGRQAAVSTA